MSRWNMQNTKNFLRYCISLHVCFNSCFCVYQILHVYAKIDNFFIYTHIHASEATAFAREACSLHYFLCFIKKTFGNLHFHACSFNVHASACAINLHLHTSFRHLRGNLRVNAQNLEKLNTYCTYTQNIRNFLRLHACFEHWRLTGFLSIQSKNYSRYWNSLEIFFPQNNFTLEKKNCSLFFVKN